MEFDPDDHKIAFAEITDVPEINSLEDACMVLAGLHRTAVALFEQEGFVMYPIYRVDHAPGQR